MVFSTWPVFIMTVVPARFTAFLNPDLAEIVSSDNMDPGDIPTHCEDDVAKSQGLAGVGGVEGLR
jgi:hypothetical protein